MPLFDKLLLLARRHRRSRSLRPRRGPGGSTPFRRMQVEMMEPRLLLSAGFPSIHVGAVYYEDASGHDEAGDRIEVTYSGGAPGTELSELLIETDKLGDGLTIGDVFFDTQPTDPGAFDAGPFAVQSQEGIDSVAASVDDGGTTLRLRFSGFDPGDRLVLTIDVDEQGFLGPNAVAEGNEFEGSRMTATFRAPHYYDAVGTDIFVDYYGPRLASSGLDLPADNFMPPNPEPTPIRTAGAIFSLVQRPLPVTVAGAVYEDVNLDNVQQSGEPGLAGVALELFSLQGETYRPTGLTTTTDEQGRYVFQDLLPGTYRIVERQPDGLFSVGATAGAVDGAGVGRVLDADVITDIELLGGQASVGNDFAEANPATLAGYVYHDADNDGVKDRGESGIGGVTVRLVYLGPLPSGQSFREVVTNPDGSWSAAGLKPGQYRVEELQPAGYLDGLDQPGTAGGTAHNPGDVISGIWLNSGQAGRHYNFGELVPSSLAGRVIADSNGNCIYDAGDTLLAGVTVELLDESEKILATTRTDALGRYQFGGLPPGLYSVREIQPAGLFDGGDHVGTAGGTLVPPDTISDIRLSSGTTAEGYDFCEILPSRITGRVVADLDGDGQLDPDETPIAGVSVLLVDQAGDVLQTTQTDEHGRYAFVDLPPGAYGVRERQPAGYFDGADHVGTAGGRLVAPDEMTGIELISGTMADEYDFLEILPSRITGRVAVDRDGNGRRDAGEPPLGGVAVELRSESGRLISTARTDSAGRYRFDGLPPGIYGVYEEQPEGYFDGQERVGSAGGKLVPPDGMAGIVLVSGTLADGYDFLELEPVSLSGFVYLDDSNDGVRDPGEAGIEGVQLVLLDGAGQPTGRTARTGRGGSYRFDGLPPFATYGLSEVQPEGLFDGLDTAGTMGGVAHNPGDAITGISLPAGTTGKNYNFGELRPASLEGRVFVDSNGNCRLDAGETPLAGVVVYLLDGRGNRIRGTTTDGRGAYRFDMLPPGVYGVEEITPEGYYDGPDRIGSAGGRLAGVDTILSIPLAPGTAAVDYDFCERLPASLSGYVFQDGPALHVMVGGEVPDLVPLRDGRRTPDDVPLPGVRLQLGDASGAPVLGADGKPMVTWTDENGYYEFGGLEPGVYTVLETQPEGYVDGIDTPGSKGGIAVNPHDPPSPAILQKLTVDPNNDAILLIRLEAGDRAHSYNFSEVLVVGVPPVVPPPAVERTPQPPAVIPMEPPQRPLLEPLAPVRPRREPFIPTGGIPLTYTWHLSVINGGYPRSASGGIQRVADATSSYFSSASWSAHAMSEGQFVLADDRGMAWQELLFGVEDALPVAGDFNGDGVAEVGVFHQGVWFIDLNGNGVWDENDLWVRLGDADDRPVVGDWDGDGKADIGVFGPAWEGDARALAVEAGLPDAANPTSGRFKNLPPKPEEATGGMRVLQQSARGNIRADLIDHVFEYGCPTDVPVAGDWNGDGVSNIGMFRGGTWFLDADGDGKWSAGDRLVEHLGQAGDVPVVGDWNGDGTDDLGVYRQGSWLLDTTGDYRLDARDQVFQLGGPGDLPVVGDFDGDGVDQIGVYRKADHSPEATAARGGPPVAETSARR